MRRACSDVGFIYADESKKDLLGINLGWDFVSEHEWGIKRIRQELGMPSYEEPNNFGAKGRTITILPENLFFGCTKTEVFLVLVDYMDRSASTTEKKIEIVKKYHDFYRNNGTDLVTAWDEKSFGIRADIKYKKELEEIWNAFQRKDMLIMLGGRKGFGNSGLVFGIVSRLPDQVKKELYDFDESQYNLKKEVEKIDIEQKLKKAEKRYYALSPRWITDEKTQSTTSYKVIFWLNPMEQDKNNYGWFTVEELEQWANNTGPIPKTEEKK